jgi:RND family efflux transporter MFP subunit
MNDNAAPRIGIVALVEPVTDAVTRTDALRIVLSNTDGALRPGMYVEARLHAQIRDAAVLVPDEAVLRSGGRNLVFVALGGGRFEPRPVTLGIRDDNNRYEVTSGLRPGETIVTSGQFLLDSESQLREAIARMLAQNK